MVYQQDCISVFSFFPLSGCVVRPDVQQRANRIALWVMKFNSVDLLVR